jgi:hypothetical protein
MGKNIPNNRKIYQMAIKYTKKQPLQLQDPPKVTQIGILGLKICHLATPVRGVGKRTRDLSLFILFHHHLATEPQNGRFFANHFDKATILLAGLPDGMFFKPKIQIWVNFGGPCSEKSWYILWPFGIFHGH